jgi:serine phosphatase RsbU (regulator of sigma subunit)
MTAAASGLTKPAQEMCEAIVAEWKQHSQHVPQADDVTLITACVR